MLKKLFLFVLFSSLVYAQQKAYSEISVEFKNDVFFAGDDKDYTSGFEISYKSKDQSYKLYLGQDIYTPVYYNETYPSANQHPYAGWLYIGIEKDFKIYKNINSIIRLDVGTVGDNSLAKESSDTVHSIIDAHKYYGWDTQMQKDLAYILSLKIEYDYALSSNIQLNPYIDIQTGNIIQNYGVGIDLNIDVNSNFGIYCTAQTKHISKNYFLEGEAKYPYLTYKAIKKDRVNYFAFGIQTRYIDDYKIILGAQIYSNTYENQLDNSKLGVIKVVKRF
jgi:hypothetical protein